MRLSGTLQPDSIEFVDQKASSQSKVSTIRCAMEAHLKMVTQTTKDALKMEGIQGQF